MRVLRVADWSRYFEVNRTREVKRMTWIALPNKQDGDGYTELLDHPEGAAHFGAWTAILQVASKCDPRGTLLRDCRRAHTAASLSRVTRIPEAIIAAAIERLLVIGWLEVSPTESIEPQEPAVIPQEGAVIPQEGVATRQDKTLQDKTGQDHKASLSASPTPEVLVRIWNENRGALPGCRGLNEKRRRSARLALKEIPDLDRWVAAAIRASHSDFCLGLVEVTDRATPWKASFEWFAKAESLLRIEEGKYDNRGQSAAKHVTRQEVIDHLRRRNAAAADAQSEGATLSRDEPDRRATGNNLGR